MCYWVYRIDNKHATPVENRNEREEAVELARKLRGQWVETGCPRPPHFLVDYFGKYVFSTTEEV